MPNAERNREGQDLPLLNRDPVIPPPWHPGEEPRHCDTAYNDTRSEMRGDRRPDPPPQRGQGNENPYPDKRVDQMLKNGHNI